MTKKSEIIYSRLLKLSTKIIELNDKQITLCKSSHEYAPVKIERVQNQLDMADENFQQALEKVDEKSLNDVREKCKYECKSIVKMFKNDRSSYYLEFGNQNFKSTVEYRSIQNLAQAAEMELVHRANENSLSK